MATATMTPESIVEATERLGLRWKPSLGILVEWDTEDGRTVYVMQMIFNGRVSIGPKGSLEFTDVYCYESVGVALVSALTWNPATEKEPQGWFRSPSSGRRRPDADPDQEYIRW